MSLKRRAKFMGARGAQRPPVNRAITNLADLVIARGAFPAIQID